MINVLLLTEGNPTKVAFKQNCCLLTVSIKINLSSPILAASSFMVLEIMLAMKPLNKIEAWLRIRLVTYTIMISGTPPPNTTEECPGFILVDVIFTQKWLSFDATKEQQVFNRKLVSVKVPFPLSFLQNQSKPISAKLMFTYAWSELNFQTYEIVFTKTFVSQRLLITMLSMLRGRGSYIIGGARGKGTVIRTPGLPIVTPKQHNTSRRIMCLIFINNSPVIKIQMIQIKIRTTDLLDTIFYNF